jgi:acyl-coenzyme A synthetase/AMP-(fatty) acid ligase
MEIENVIEEHPEVLEAGVFGTPDDLVQVCLVQQPSS